jgi:hypothetical protein
MDPVSMATLLKKHGITALLCLCVVWLNNRMLKQDEKIERVEQRLYECLQESAYKNQDMNLKERWQSKTPDFWKKVQKIGIAFGVIGGAIIAAPVALPAALITAGGYMIAVGSVTATLSQLTKEDAAK